MTNSLAGGDAIHSYSAPIRATESPATCLPGTRAQQAAKVFTRRSPFLCCRPEVRTAERRSCVSCQASASIAVRSETSDTEQCTMHSVRRRPVLRFFVQEYARGGGKLKVCRVTYEAFDTFEMDKRNAIGKH